MDPDFGVGLRNFLFEQKDHVMPKIRQRIERQVRKYMPFIRINKILFNHNINPRTSNESTLLSLLIEYDVPSLNLSTNLIIQGEDVN